MSPPSSPGARNRLRNEAPATDSGAGENGICSLVSRTPFRSNGSSFAPPEPRTRLYAKRGSQDRVPPAAGDLNLIERLSDLIAAGDHEPAAVA